MSEAAFQEPTPINVGLPGPLRADADEIALVGSCLLDPSLVASLKLRPEDFFQTAPRATFAAMRAIVDRGDLPIFTTLVAELAALGGHVRPSTVLDWVNACPTPIHAVHYARNVARAAQRRRLLSASTNVSTLAVDPFLTSEQAVDAASAVVSDVRMAAVNGPELATASESVQAFTIRKEALRNGDDGSIGTGFYDLDTYLSGGLRPGQLCIIGGRPGAGKSALLRDIARAMAYRGPVLFASDEMGVADVTDRDIAAMSGVSLAAIVSGRWSKAEDEAIRDATATLEFLPLMTFADGGMTSDSLRAKAGQLHAQTPFVAIVVDYLQRLADPGKSDLERVSRIARALKTLAMELGVPVLAASQLSRTQERESQDSRPTLIDLRSSGEIEQEADIVLLLYRPSYYYPTEEAWRAAKKMGRYPGNETELIIGKQRQGVSGVTVRLLWMPLLASFRNLATRPDGRDDR